MTKYFPAEAFAAYATLQPLVLSVTNSVDGARLGLWLALIICVVFCAAFLRTFWGVERPQQIVISCVALVVYVAALGGPFVYFEWWKQGYAVILAVLMTMALLFVPSPPSEPPAPPAA